MEAVVPTLILVGAVELLRIFNCAVGAVVPMPTQPLSNTVIRSAGKEFAILIILLVVVPEPLIYNFSDGPVKGWPIVSED
jgi:hypothetical protein